MADRNRILVTGASGFVGRRLVAQLRQLSGIKVLGVCGPNHAGGLDLTDFAACSRLVNDFQPSKIVHLAAQSSVGTAFGDPAAVWRANFDATRNLAQAVSAQESRPHFIFASSAEVYGAGFNLGPRSERDAILPNSPYGRSKAAAEMLLADMAGDRLAVTTLRLFNHTGPGQDRRFAIPAFASQIARVEVLNGSQAIRVGNLDAQRDFTDVDDIVDAYVAVISGAIPEEAQIFNVGSGEHRRVGDLLDILIRLSAVAITVEQDQTRMRPSDVPVAAGVFNKFAAAYEWQPRRVLEHTLAAVLGFERSDLTAATDHQTGGS
nr:NAD-dependent epimerase/dehydratase family protein [Brevundimonas naejangsanensis]